MESQPIEKHGKTVLGTPQDQIAFFTSIHPSYPQTGECQTLHGNRKLWISSVASVACFGCALFVLLEPLAQELIACFASKAMLIETTSTRVEQTKQGFTGT